MFWVPAVPALKHIFNEIHYEMVRKIADGGMGVGCEAERLGAGRFRKVVAVKLIRADLFGLGIVLTELLLGRTYLRRLFAVPEEASPPVFDAPPAAAALVSAASQPGQPKVES